ncbi:MULTISPECIES: hypothetical protein [Acinetobacter]|uniref:DUF4760 domain-containing protein n=2 Tax=Acinetobacter TaxID=469 RepID=A0A836MJ41_ACINO|nr:MULTISPECIES: hypothetical protein [Acinetobacter]EKT7958935.1 hypothetical protein [Acinetobacter baumannii]EKU0425111.1 hypothetical protein [Acinetobacter baumannii]EKU2422921.1 hypothetical protein [Acinetobacter baumannii]EKV4643338.1 hypothetical protein [Acinetobacter baumannii]EKV6477462.1 hypothetical protein [Acinetobacter baumannii]
MNSKIKVLLIDTIGWITSICIIFFFFTLWLYSYNQIDNPLKEAWSLTVSILSALATIGAAIIAANLFNDWRESQTGINRSELAKNTQTSLYKLVSYLDYYHQYVMTQKHIFIAKSFPEISQNFIDQAEKIANECEERRSIFRNECEELYKQFLIDLKIYEKTFDTDLNLDLSRIRYYRGSIGGMLRDLSQSKSVFELNRMTNHMKTSKKLFNKEILDIVNSEMSQYINLKVK